MKVGFVLNIACVVVLTVAVNTYGIPFFKLDEFPDWAEKLVAKHVEMTTVFPNNTTNTTSMF